jgi:hypothetical protein
MLKKFFDKHILELIFIANHSMTQTIPITCAQNNSNRPALTGGMKRLYDSPGTAVELRPGDNVFDAHLATCGQRRRSRSTGRLLRRIFHVKQRLQAFEMPTLPLFYRHHSLAIARQRSSVMQRGGGGGQRGRGNRHNNTTGFQCRNTSSWGSSTAGGGRQATTLNLTQTILQEHSL